MFRRFIYGAALVLAIQSSSHAGLRHLYTFNDGTANDTALGGGANGTLENSALVINGQLALPGGPGGSASPHVSLPAAAIGINAYTSATLELWVTVNPSVANQFTWGAGFGRNGDAGDVGSETLGHDYIMMNVTRAGEGGRAAITDNFFDSETGVTGPVLSGGQKHVVMTINSAGVDNTTIGYYVNGALINTATGADDLADVSNAMALLGKSLYNGDPFFAGTINEFRLYDNALSAAQVQADFVAGPAGTSGPTLTINRSTGAVSFTNASPSIQILKYTIDSPLGAINTINWTPVAGRVDAGPAFFGTGDGTFDADDTWSVTTITNTSISEDMNFDGTADNGGTVGNVGLGNAWKKYYQEDLSATLLVLVNGTTQITIPANVAFTGNGGKAFTRSDINFDGSLSGLDWAAFRTNLGATLPPTLSDIDSYTSGDVDGDQDVDYFDYRIFKADFDLANGTGALEALIRAVPEPGSLCLLGIAGIALAWSRRRERTLRVMRLRYAVIVTAVGCGALAFGTGSGPVARAGVISYSLTAPTTDANDVFNLTGATMDRNNILGDGVNDGGGNDAGTYIAQDRAQQGQTFTTGATAGFLQSVWVQHVGYTGNSPGNVGNGTYYLVAPGADFRVRVTNPTAAGTANFSLLDDTFVTTGTETNTIPTAFTNTNDGTGRWMKFTFGAPILLAPNTVYGFDVTSLNGGPNAFFETLGTSANPYAGGAAYNGSTNGGTDNTLNALTGDRVFVADILAPGSGLSLLVNKNTGATVVRNNTAAAVTFDYYEIASPDADGPGGAPGGALNTANFPAGWNSLSDQNIDAGVQGDFNASGTVTSADLGIIRSNFSTGTTKAQGDANGDGKVNGADFLIWQSQLGKTPGEGDSWDEGGGSSNLKLIEAFLNGATTLAPGSQLSLGNAFNPTVFGAGVNGNLTFRYGLPGQGTLTIGDVQYVTSGPITAVPEPTGLISAAIAAALSASGFRLRRRAA